MLKMGVVYCTLTSTINLLLKTVWIVRWCFFLVPELWTKYLCFMRMKGRTTRLRWWKWSLVEYFLTTTYNKNRRWVCNRRKMRISRTNLWHQRGQGLLNLIMIVLKNKGILADSTEGPNRWVCQLRTKAYICWITITDC